jgi:hypothetical protein
MTHKGIQGLEGCTHEDLISLADELTKTLNTSVLEGLVRDIENRTTTYKEPWLERLVKTARLELAWRAKLPEHRLPVTLPAP